MLRCLLKHEEEEAIYPVTCGGAALETVGKNACYNNRENALRTWLGWENTTSVVSMNSRDSCGVAWWTLLDTSRLLAWAWSIEARRVAADVEPEKMSLFFHGVLPSSMQLFVTSRKFSGFSNYETTSYGGCARPVLLRPQLFNFT